MQASTAQLARPHAYREIRCGIAPVLEHMREQKMCMNMHVSGPAVDDPAGQRRDVPVCMGWAHISRHYGFAGSEVGPWLARRPAVGRDYAPLGGALPHGPRRAVRHFRPRIRMPRGRPAVAPAGAVPPPLSGAAGHARGGVEGLRTGSILFMRRIAPSRPSPAPELDAGWPSCHPTERHDPQPRAGHIRRSDAGMISCPVVPDRSIKQSAQPDSRGLSPPPAPPNLNRTTTTPREEHHASAQPPAPRPIPDHRASVRLTRGGPRTSYRGWALATLRCPGCYWPGRARHSAATARR